MIRFSIDDDGQFKMTSGPVGDVTGSKKNDFYVYEWYVVNTGEVFYVGKGRGKRYKEFHDHAYAAEKIRKLYKTDNKFAGTGLTEQEAVDLESAEMTRILNETDDRLTNRQIPFFTKRKNGYDPAPDTPSYRYDVSPVQWVDEIDQHYFGDKPRQFDPVTAEGLKTVTFDTPQQPEQMNTVYGGEFGKVINETVWLLHKFGTKVAVSEYGKAVTGWIYSQDEMKVNIDVRKQNALERAGHHIAAYHLVDVHHFLVDWAKQQGIELSEMTVIDPAQNGRTPIETISKVEYPSKRFDALELIYRKGDDARNRGDFGTAIRYLDQAREGGFLNSWLYDSYYKIYRKQKNYQAELAMTEEAMKVFPANENPRDYMDALKRKLQVLQKM